ncbi:hypothetical protein V9T40_013132 [Parthenolecanium corni]|uniref:Uncharacterized protein n=1 Tax=Parthenolecanium corni TaxID=536013 RepID=A0AAN9TJA4_9HEMI
MGSARGGHSLLPNANENPFLSPPGALQTATRYIRSSSEHSVRHVHRHSERPKIIDIDRVSFLPPPPPLTNDNRTCEPVSYAVKKNEQQQQQQRASRRFASRRKETRGDDDSKRATRAAEKERRAKGIGEYVYDGESRSEREKKRDGTGVIRDRVPD